MLNVHVLGKVDKSDMYVVPMTFEPVVFSLTLSDVTEKKNSMRERERERERKKERERERRARKGERQRDKKG